MKNVGSFTIQFIIIGKKFSGALSNLGVSINLMLYLVYETLDHGDFKETNVAIQLENCTNRYPKFLVEDVLVQVNELIFCADFFVFEMEHDSMHSTLPLIMGIPFLRTFHTRIDIHEGTLTMKIEGEIVKFRLLDAIRYPNNFESSFSIDEFDYIV